MENLTNSSLQNDNTTVMMRGGTQQSPALVAVAIISGVTHLIFVILFCLVLGSVLLYILVSDFKKTRTPTSLVFIIITAQCMVAPTLYGFLYDISLITDTPAAGGCDTPETVWVDGTFIGSHGYLFANTALLSVMQYATVRVGKKKLLKPTIIAAVVLLVMSLGNTTRYILQRAVDNIATIKVRGSECDYISPGLVGAYFFTAIIGLLILFILTPAAVAFIGTILTYVHVKKHTLDGSDVIKTVLKITALITTTLLVTSMAPFLVFTIANLVPAIRQNFAILGLVLFFGAELSYPFYLIVITCVHKTVRERFKGIVKNAASNVKNSVTSSNSVSPS